MKSVVAISELAEGPVCLSHLKGSGDVRCKRGRLQHVKRRVTLFVGALFITSGFDRRLHSEAF